MAIAAETNLSGPLEALNYAAITYERSVKVRPHINRRRDCLINKNVIMSNHFIVNQIPSRGKTIVRKLCSGADNCQSTRALLTEAGVPVPEEVNSVRLTLDKLMDTDFPRLNRE